MKSKEWQQVMADVFDIDVVIPNVLEEATSMGAAVAGGVGDWRIRRLYRY